jgi:hypothetical protein
MLRHEYNTNLKHYFKMEMRNQTAIAAKDAVSIEVFNIINLKQS